MSPTTPRSSGGPAAAPSLSSHPPQSDPFDFILEECGRLSPSQEARLRNAPFLRRERLNPANLLCDERALTYHVMYCIFGFENAHRPGRRRPRTDADSAELALTDYFLALGPRRVHLLQTRKGRRRAGRAQHPSGTREAAEKGPEGLPPPAVTPPLGEAATAAAAAAAPAPPAVAGKDKLAGVKRARADFSKPPRSQSHAADERPAMGKKSCVNPAPVNPPPAAPTSAGAGLTPTGDTSAVGGGPPSAGGVDRRRRNLPPSFLCPDDWESGHNRSVRPPAQADQITKGKAPAGSAVLSTADAAGVKEKQGQGKGGASGDPSPAATVPVERRPPPPPERGEGTSPSVVGSDGVTLSAFVEALLKFSNRSRQKPVKVAPFEALAKGSLSLPVPKWWKPGGCGGDASTPPDK